MSIPKASLRAVQSSQSLKRKTPSRRIVTLRTESAHSKKTTSSRSPALLQNNEERISQPLNRILIVDKNSPLHNEFSTALQMNMIITVDYEKNTFSVIKNRWGDNIENISLKYLGKFITCPHDQYYVSKIRR